MKKKFFIFCLFIGLPLGVVLAQEELNLDFEIVARDGNYPVKWSSSGSHIAFLDENIKKHGINAIRLEIAPDNDARAWSYYSNKLVLAEYTGKDILLRGYLKTEGLTGSAGLYMHQQGGTYFKLETINLDNMEGRRLKGSNDWTPVLLKMPFPSNLYQIEFGIYIEGKGKVWADDLKLLIDGKPYFFAPKRDSNSTNSHSTDKKNNLAEEKTTPYYKKKAQETMKNQNEARENQKNKIEGSSKN